ncbi:MAG TPA: universal stress protein [Vicinamibacterales bacterium]|nr:universal stress protein [Vicinamibacterales bacterium]
MTNRRRPADRARPSRTSESPFRHILVPTDLTERTEKALQLASQLARRDGGRVTLLHVIETIPGLTFGEASRLYQRLERKARKPMDALIRRAGADGTTALHAFVYGRRADEIVRYAAEHEVDLIVLASHRVKPTRVDRDWGTISYKVGILAQCPVLLVK